MFFHLCSVWYFFFGTSMMWGMWEFGDGEAVFFRLISLFLSVCWLEKLMVSHGASVVVLG